MILTKRVLDVFRTFKKIEQSCVLKNGLLHTKALNNTAYCKANFQVESDSTYFISDIGALLKLANSGSVLKDLGDRYLLTNVDGAEYVIEPAKPDSVITPKEELKLPTIDHKFNFNSELVREINADIGLVQLMQKDDSFSISIECQGDRTEILKTKREFNGEFCIEFNNKQVSKLGNVDMNIYVTKQGVAQFSARDASMIIAIESNLFNY
ncbi:hypothetical protein QTV43_003996 [Vibrio vulnificus]|nr:hypothetical protein [Vibrio vulnificus]